MGLDYAIVLKGVSEKNLKKVFKITMHISNSRYYSKLIYKLILVVHVTLEKNMNILTIFVTKQKCTCSLLLLTEAWKALTRKSIYIKFFFISYLKKLVKMKTN